MHTPGNHARHRYAGTKRHTSAMVAVANLDRNKLPPAQGLFPASTLPRPRCATAAWQVAAGRV